MVIYLHRKKDLNGEESLVLSHIQASNNEGNLKPQSLYMSIHDEIIAN